MLCLVALRREGVRHLQGIVPSRGLALQNGVATTADPVPVLQNKQRHLVVSGGVIVLHSPFSWDNFSRITGRTDFEVDGECGHLVCDGSCNSIDF